MIQTTKQAHCLAFLVREPMWQSARSALLTGILSRIVMLCECSHSGCVCSVLDVFVLFGSWRELLNWINPRILNHLHALFFNPWIHELI